MNLNSEKYSRYALVREMLETTEVVRRFDMAIGLSYAEKAKAKKGLFLTGEGSSRIFPAKRLMYDNLKWGSPLAIFTDGSTQAIEYKLGDLAVFGASNSGQTKEIIRLFMKLREEGHDALFGLTANEGTKLATLAHETHVLGCGKEDAVALSPCRASVPSGRRMRQSTLGITLPEEPILWTSGVLAEMIGVASLRPYPWYTGTPMA